MPPSKPLSPIAFPPLHMARVGTIFDESGKAQLISTRQPASSMAAPGAFSMDALTAVIQGERLHTQALVLASTEPLVAQIAALTAQAAQAREETARVLREHQVAQETRTTNAIAEGFKQMLSPNFIACLASAIAQQPQPAPKKKDEDEA